PKGPAVFRLKDHIKRLMDGCKIMGIEPKVNGKLMTQKDIEEAHKEIIRENKKLGFTTDYIKPTVFLSGEEVGLNPTKVPSSLSICCVYMGSYLGEDASAGAKLITSSWHRPDNLCSPAGAKVNGTYVTSTLAKREAIRQGADEAVMLNSCGHVAECTGENIFIYRKGVIYTPSVSESILEGITRDSIIKVARDMGYTVIEKEISRSELISADEVWMTGTAAEIGPVTMIDGRVIGDGKIGKVATEIHKKFIEITTGKDSKYDAWLDYVN
ncbi:MAG: branched-chain amino acid transaminase, partial [Candidatus Methanomethylophilaceae archaeon]|nr:branched-chain amino acid transaminase [Candidatus Methanomethylophilaceae archaeon]